MSEDFVVRHAAARVGSGLRAPARVNQAGELVEMPLLWDLALQGRVFVGGHGIEETATDSESTLQDQTPMFALFADTGGSSVVFPLSIQVRLHADGGAASELYAAYVQSDVMDAGTGTSMDILNCLGGVNPRVPNAKLEKSLASVTAFGDNANVMFMRRADILDEILAAEMITRDAQVEMPGRNTLEYVWTPPSPYALYKGSSIAVFAKTASTDSTWSATFFWAELDASVYLPDGRA